jgi:hypothetical protein
LDNTSKMMSSSNETLVAACWLGLASIGCYRARTAGKESPMQVGRCGLPDLRKRDSEFRELKYCCDICSSGLSTTSQWYFSLTLNQNQPLTTGARAGPVILGALGEV